MGAMLVKMLSPVLLEDLVHGWQFRQAESEEASWLSVSRVPTCVHLDLMAHGLIPDPFIGFNELHAEWVGEKTWSYRIELPEWVGNPTRQTTVIACDGLDTFATVRLNGSMVLRSENMFVPYRIDITKQIKANIKNILTIDFEPALLRAVEIRKQHPDHKWLSFNADASRLGVRKAQYHWGWDWGPFLMTAGPWRPVRLERYDARLEDLWAEYLVEVPSRRARGSLFAKVEAPPGTSLSFNIAFSSDLIWSQPAKVGPDNIVQTDFDISDVRMWYPHGYGSQPLYEISVDLVSNDILVDRKAKKIGFRHIELVQRPDQAGKTFYFRINGVEIFSGGSDWIPADSFVTRISRAKYRRWVQLLVDGNQVMIRVWGGGIWESQDFYDACDELGVMVWQDFMFSCGNYPAWDSLLSSIRMESVANVRAIRHHPCIVVYAGNNEDYQVQEQSGLTYDYNDKNPQNWLKTDFPARYIYEKILPDVVAAECPGVPYHPGSPWGDGKPTSDPSVGDMHQWNVWHGTQEKYQIFDRIGGRFNSEFGMEAFPHVETIKYYCQDESMLYPQSRLLDFHNKALGAERRIATYVVENFRIRTELEAYIHLTQLAQSECMMFGYRGWRKRWGQERLCGGALVWQLNDCWPVTSWSIVDYFFRKKPAYYSIARTLAPIAIGVQREHHDWSVAHARPAQSSDYELWVVSSRLRDVFGAVELRYVSIETGQDIKPKVIERNVRIVPNGTTLVLKGVIDNVKEEAHVLAARVLVDGEVVARDVDWPQPFKYLSFRSRGVQVVRGDGTISVSAAKPTKGLVFEEREGVRISDSAIDVVPGDTQLVKVQGLATAAEPLRWTYLGENES